MDILKNRNYNSYDYTSRYNVVPYSYHTLDEKYIYHIGSNLNKDMPYVLHKVAVTDTLDYLALRYYNNPTYFWVIAYFNDIQDCFITLFDEYKTLKIPNISAIEFGDER